MGFWPEEYEQHAFNLELLLNKSWYFFVAVSVRWLCSSSCFLSEKIHACTDLLSDRLTGQNELTQQPNWYRKIFFIASGREYLINKSWKLNKLFFHATIFYHCSDEYLFMASWLIIMVHSFQAWLWMDRLTNSLFNWVIWTQTQCLPRWVVWLTGVSISANQTKHTTRKHIYPHSYIYIQNAYF